MKSFRRTHHLRPFYYVRTIVNSQFDTLGVHDVGFKAEHGEHHERGQHRREEVNEGDENCVKVAVVVALVVTGEGNDATKAQA